MHGPAAVAGSAVRKIVDFELPTRRPGCGVITEGPHRFCLQCWQSLTFLGDPSCARCGLPCEYDAGEGVECGACLADPPSFDRLRAAVAYGEVARKVALKLKYSGRAAVAETLAHFMQRHLTGEKKDAILVPVPLHRWRIWTRGYNQSALIPQALSKRTGLAVELDVLRRVKATPPLKGMGRRERALAVQGAFALREGATASIEGHTVVLIDDVYTGGATARTCARMLKRKGAETVNILCWARVVASKDI